LQQLVRGFDGINATELPEMFIEVDNGGPQGCDGLLTEMPGWESTRWTSARTMTLARSECQLARAHQLGRWASSHLQECRLRACARVPPRRRHLQASPCCCDAAPEGGVRFQILSDLGEVNSASESRLADFISNGFKRFPPGSGREYFLALSDHGGGYLGFAQDAVCSPGDKFVNGGQCSWMSMPNVTRGEDRRWLRLWARGCPAGPCELQAALSIEEPPPPLAHLLQASELG
jgi:hypothetical protein